MVEKSGSIPRRWNAQSFLAQGAPLSSVTAKEARAVLRDWNFWAHPAQRPPEGRWRVWLFLGGRGSGKTRAGAQWILSEAKANRAARIALVGPTLHDAQSVMLEGPSGLLTLVGRGARYEVTRRRVLFENGAQAHLFSAEDPESLRGPQFDLAWGDELAAWRQGEATLAQLQLSVRLGIAPRMMISSTPKSTRVFRDLVAAPGVVVTHARTIDNRANLGAGYIDTVTRLFGAKTFGRQELDGEILPQDEGALWRRCELENCRIDQCPPLERVVVGVDPPASAHGDLCGIVAVGLVDGPIEAPRCVVLADASMEKARPRDWAMRVDELARATNANCIVAEANNGGEMVRETLRAAATYAPVRLVHASHSKRARAEPIAAAYQCGRIVHLGDLRALEDQMCQFGAPDYRGSPDRVDALVWALSELLFHGAAPRLRTFL
jgi:phage terminase large subunit-like protein